MDKYYIYKYCSYMNNLPWYFFDNSSENLVSMINPKLNYVKNRFSFGKYFIEIAQYQVGFDETY